MAGRGERFRQKNFSAAKPLIKWQNKPLFLWSLESTRAIFRFSTVHFVICEEDQIEQDVLSYVQNETSLPKIKIIVLKERTTGPALSAEKALRQSLVTEGPIIFCDCDLICISKAWEDFIMSWSADVSGALLWFYANKNKHSFIKTDLTDNVIEIAEKKIISDKAVAGIYAFRDSQIFFDALQSALQEPSGREKYLSDVYGELIKRKKNIRAFPIDKIILLGTPDELSSADPNSI